MNNIPKLSFVTACKGRLEHLKQTLPKRIHPDCENIVVDWSCPDNCGDWVEENYPDVKVIRVPKQATFNHSKSRNVGFSHATGEFICQADADLIVNPSFFELLPTFKNDAYYARIPLQLFTDSFFATKKPWPQGEQGKEKRKKLFNEISVPTWEWVDNDGITQRDHGPLTGCVVFPREMVNKVGGFDTSIEQYGCEDLAFRVALVMEGGLTECTWKEGYIDTINHSDADRMKFQTFDNVTQAAEEGWKQISLKRGTGWGRRVIAIINRRNKIK